MFHGFLSVLKITKKDKWTNHLCSLHFRTSSIPGNPRKIPSLVNGDIPFQMWYILLTSPYHPLGHISSLLPNPPSESHEGAQKCCLGTLFFILFSHLTMESCWSTYSIGRIVLTIHNSIYNCKQTNKFTLKTLTLFYKLIFRRRW